MKPFQIHPASFVKGEITLPSDKSISHRAVFIGSIAKGKTILENFSLSKDCLYTLGAFKKLRVKIKKEGRRLTIYGKGLKGLKPIESSIFVGDSGTTIRLLCGVLAGQNFDVTLKAGPSLSKRPMRRVLEPLRMMGANIESLEVRDNEEYPPLVIKGGCRLKAIEYNLPVASAQVKSSILLAGLFAEGVTVVQESIKTRDHTERLLYQCGVDIKIKNQKIFLRPPGILRSPEYILIPGDISSASFFLVAAILLKNSYLKINNIGFNPTRLGLVRVLKRMGANIDLRYKILDKNFQEPLGDITVSSSSLKAVYVKKEEIPSLIDELPILMVAASFAKGKTIIESVQELRFKETDRIRSMMEGLSYMGAKISLQRKRQREDIVIEGVDSLKGAKLHSFGDHRTAMALVVAGLAAKKGESLIDDVSCVSKSFPNFLGILKRIVH
ncbi:MAG: 3-phosphoshikimate 1-carboxyvinyltransferase [Candidatus Omnitrophica bacterium]|nr:3-phosphoshikimate 1-carboxyvinyltransferase [Candidatus Omnitrophota bacterium]